ncbi:SHOCT domain-containing protein [Flavobacterium silvaticum]|uniref:SHOCT domain-containing protein n=1 Tax=Flavobacterium silvaticum TaxID=1852020 RepID=A0A972FJU5_9FLAO|nr:SHOCT domain-containing protein [Flavobacterium silvaticum]NMH26530.1 SHOCT domain-containing protein [Flavobacterium silvaticum]
METKTIPFASGSIEVTDSKISFRSAVKDIKQFQSMERHNMGHVNSEQYTYLGIMPIQLALRSLLFGVMLAVIAIAADIQFFSVVGVAAIVFGLVTFNLDLWVDGFLGTRFGYQLCAYFFASKGHKITIQNNSGGDHIVFYVALEQLDEAMKLESYRITERPDTNPVQPIGGIHDLEKINELYQKGILTEEEFTQKKKQLLNL